MQTFVDTPQTILSTCSLGSPLEKIILEACPSIEEWLKLQWRKTSPPFYSSVDLRYAGFKLAPIDTNIFPAGFNNLNLASLDFPSQCAQETLSLLAPINKKNIILIPENHTRNLFYYESVAIIQAILSNAGFKVKIGSFREDIGNSQVINLASGKQISLHPLRRENKELYVEEFKADLAILNNDLSEGLPPILESLEIPILPFPQLGWFRRLKSVHFYHYAQVALEIANLINLDPWLLTPYFKTVTAVNFMKREGEAELAKEVDNLLKKVQKKYDEYHISKPPFVVIKADAGTYGMGVISVNSGQEVLELNRKKRTQMSTAKGARPITQVILQEGVHTIETVNNKVAEPVIYSIGAKVIGGFYRVHKDRSATENLNMPGMEFKPFEGLTKNSFLSASFPTEEITDRAYSYTVIARLAALAAAREQQESF